MLTPRRDSPTAPLDLAEYERMVDEIELRRDVRTAVQQIDAGEGLSNRDAKAALRRRFRR